MLWTVAHQASLSMGFSRQEYWSRLPCLPPGDLPNPGTEPKSMSPTLAVLSLFRCVQLFETTWTVVLQPLSMAFSRQEYWRGLPFPSPGDLPDPGIKAMSPALAGRFFTTSATWEAQTGLASYGCCPLASMAGGIPRDFPGKNSGVDCHFLLQGSFLTQGLNPDVLHWQVDSLLLSPKSSLAVTKDPLSLSEDQRFLMLQLKPALAK